jgi:hypothetical protein
MSPASHTKKTVGNLSPASRSQTSEKVPEEKGGEGDEDKFWLNILTSSLQEANLSTDGGESSHSSDHDDPAQRRTIQDNKEEQRPPEDKLWLNRSTSTLQEAIQSTDGGESSHSRDHNDPARRRSIQDNKEEQRPPEDKFWLNRSTCSTLQEANRSTDGGESSHSIHRDDPARRRSIQDNKEEQSLSDLSPEQRSLIDMGMQLESSSQKRYGDGDGGPVPKPNFGELRIPKRLMARHLLKRLLRLLDLPTRISSFMLRMRSFSFGIWVRLAMDLPHFP